MGTLWRQTLLNFHPPVYDAFGMTILEAGAFGTPTLLAGEEVGATVLLRPLEDECILFRPPPYSSSTSSSSIKKGDEVDEFALANRVEALLSDYSVLSTIGAAARARALQQNEKAHAEAILGVIKTLITK